MTRPIVTELNITNQQLVVREMNDAEYEQHLIDEAAWEAEQTAIAAAQAEANALDAAKKAAKTEALAALGLSQEVVNLLAE